MVDDAIKLLTGQTTVGEAWKALFPSSGANALTASSKIAIKINLLNSSVVPPHPFIVLGIVEGLMQMSIGGSPLTRSNITIYDSNNSNCFNAKGYNATNFPGITLVGTDTLSNHGDGARGLNYANSLFNANFLINIPGIRGHGTSWSSSALGGATLGYKSHLGTYPTTAHNDPQNYLRDYVCTGPVFNKHVLTVANAIYANNFNNGPSAGSPDNYNQYAKTMDAAVATSRPNCDTIIMSTDPVSAEFQMYKVMCLNASPTKSYVTANMPDYLKASAGITSLTPLYNIGVLSEAGQNVGKIINGTFTGWTGIEALPGGKTALLKLSVFPNPVRISAYFDIWTPESMAGKKVMLEIYNMQGRLVFSSKPSLNGACTHAVWNGRTPAGRAAASGKYLAYVMVGKDVLKTAFTLMR
jgi:hypothetical protein